MAKKLNMVAVKEFLLKHGEKVALGTCAFIAVTFALYGLIRAGSAGRAEGTSMASSSWSEAFTKLKNQIVQQRQAIPAEEMNAETKEKLQPEKYDWKAREASFPQAPYIAIEDSTRNSKRLNPMAYSVIDDPEMKLLEYINGGVFVHGVDQTKKSVHGLGNAEGTVPMGGGGIIPPKGGPGNPGEAVSLTYAKYVRPTRMIVGTMVFPLKKQVAEHMKALRLESQKDLFDNRDDLPSFPGFNLLRFEVLANGEFANPQGELIVGYDPATKTTKLSANLRKFYREAIFDERLPANLEPFLWHGLHMPMPALANRKYAKPVLAGIDLSNWEEDAAPDKKGMPGDKKFPGPKDGGSKLKLPGGDKKGGRPPMNPMDPGNPMGGGAGGVERPVEPIEFKKLKASDPQLANRLFSKDLEKEFNPFHAFGLKVPTGIPENKGPGMPLPGEGGKPGSMNETRFFAAWDIPIGDEVLPGNGGGPGGGGPGGGGIKPPGGGIKPGGGGELPGGGAGALEFKNWDRDALVRFIDVDVEPGKTYQYAIQVRVANPNYKKPNNLVAFNALAAMPELPLGKASWVMTKEITIPQEYHLFAVDQQLFDEWADKGPGQKNIVPKDATTFQIHQWLKTKKDLSAAQEYVVADWAVAERVVAKRGDEIGLTAPLPILELPAWRVTKDSFFLPATIKDTKKPKDMKTGVRLELRPTFTEKDGDETPLQAPVLVDFAGGKRYKAGGFVDEEAAVEALLLDSNGKLVVRNSRLDTDPAANLPSAEQEKLIRERQERVIQSRQRTIDVRDRAVVPNKGPGMPGGGAGGGAG